MRPGGVPARTGDLDGQLVARCGDGPGPGADLADIEPRVAVQSEDAVDRGDTACGHHVDRSARHLLGGLEDQPDLARQRAGRRDPGQEEPSPKQYRRVHVVAARMARTAVDRSIRHVLFVVDWQRVNVGTQGNNWLIGTSSADVYRQASAFGQDRRPQASSLEPKRDPPRCPVLVIASLRVSVQVSTEVDQLGLMAAEERIELALEIVLSHALPPRWQ